jgi:hypothetical protein
MNSQKSKPDFRIYPSLLDKFQEFLDYETAAEEPWNKVSETAIEAGKYPDKEVGDYILTPDEMCDKLEQDLVDTINRVPHEPWEAADKGTCFNEVIDMLLDGRDCQYEGMTVTMDDKVVTATLDGFTFLFDLEFCKSVAEGLIDSASQVFTTATIETEHGIVELYGYVDEFQHDKVIDLKTTTQYDFLKFERKWQRHVYPYCLVQNGYEVEGFEYRVIKWKGGTKTQPALSGEVIPEYYTYTHEESEKELKAMLDHFLDWLEANKERITDTKVFGRDGEDERPKVVIADDIDSDFIINEKFMFLPANLGHFDSIDDVMKSIVKAGLFATTEGTSAARALTEEESQEISDSIADITKDERIEAVNAVAEALAFEERMKAEAKRRKEQAQAALNEIDERIMEKAQMLKANRKEVHLDATDTIRVSVSDKNLYYHFENGCLVLANVSYASNDEMSGLFYQAEVNEQAMKDLFGIDDFAKERTFDVLKIKNYADEELIGRMMIVDPEKTSFEDFLDEDSGTVLTNKRTVKFGLKKLPAKITEKVLAKLKDEGFKTVIVSKEVSDEK